MEKYTKQPGDKLDYDIDATDWLNGDTIVSVTSTATPSGLTVVSSTAVNSGTAAKVWLNGGTDGVTYKVTATMTTNAGRIKEKEFQLKVKEV